jgi:hypothetical protein
VYQSRPPALEKKGDWVRRSGSERRAAELERKTRESTEESREQRAAAAGEMEK